MRDHSHLAKEGTWTVDGSYSRRGRCITPARDENWCQLELHTQGGDIMTGSKIYCVGNTMLGVDQMQEKGRHRIPVCCRKVSRRAMEISQRPGKASDAVPNVQQSAAIPAAPPTQVAFDHPLAPAAQRHEGAPTCRTREVRPVLRRGMPPRCRSPSRPSGAHPDS